jgi:hypothetical protein
LSAAPISVHLRPSPALTFLLVSIHLLAFVALWVSLDGLALTLASFGVMLSAALTAGDAMQRWAGSPTELELRPAGGAAWRDKRGRWHEAELARGSYVSAWLTLVPLAGMGRRRKWIVVMPDAAGAEERRRLRTWLRWRAGKLGRADE